MKNTDALKRNPHYRYLFTPKYAETFVGKTSKEKEIEATVQSLSLDSQIESREDLEKEGKYSEDEIAKMVAEENEELMPVFQTEAKDISDKIDAIMRILKMAQKHFGRDFKERIKPKVDFNKCDIERLTLLIVELEKSFFNGSLLNEQDFEKTIDKFFPSSNSLKEYLELQRKLAALQQKKVKLQEKEAKLQEENAKCAAENNAFKVLQDTAIEAVNQSRLFIANRTRRKCQATLQILNDYQEKSNSFWSKRKALEEPEEEPIAKRTRGQSFK